MILLYIFLCTNLYIYFLSIVMFTPAIMEIFIYLFSYFKSAYWLLNILTTITHFLREPKEEVYRWKRKIAPLVENRPFVRAISTGRGLGRG